MPATNFYYKESDLKPYLFSEKTNTAESIEKYIRQNRILEEEVIDGELYSYRLPREKIEEIYRPFYFKKYEVTIEEYWEFIEDVGDSYNDGDYYRDMTYTFEEEEGITMTVSIYPDTTCWGKDAKFSRNEPFTRNYFTQESYENYPAVGVSYLQAKAFCH